MHHNSTFCGFVFSCLFFLFAFLVIDPQIMAPTHSSEQLEGLANCVRVHEFACVQLCICNAACRLSSHTRILGLVFHDETRFLRVIPPVVSSLLRHTFCL